jgi:uncharacterized protein (DUF433 family)
MTEVNSKPSQLFQVRLTEAEKRRMKTLAASQGLTLRQATVQAYEAWAAQLRSPPPSADTMAGATAGADSDKPGQSKHGPQESPSRAWLRHTAQLDWSKCPAVASAQGKRGKIWVVRGTDAPLVEVLHAVSEGHPLLEIAKVFELTLQQLVAVLQFAAEGAVASPAR